ncbi:MAG TPA: hypothetical protein VJ809_18190, partial [Pirellulales bacterium]|nr:hypothetical protein [Pirellulales bacterium]
MAIGSLFRVLLSRLAAEQVQQTVADNLRRAAQSKAEPADSNSATTDGASGSDPGQSPSAAYSAQRKLLPCHVGIVFALPLESGYFEDRLAGLISIKGHGFTIR